MNPYSVDCHPALPRKVAVQLADGTVSTVEVTGYSVESGGFETITPTRWEKLLRAFTPRCKRKSLLRPLSSPRVTLHTDDDLEAVERTRRRVDLLRAAVEIVRERSDG